MATITTRINGSSSQNNYDYYALVMVDDTINSDNTFSVNIDTYIVNNGTRTSSGGWTKETRIDGVGEKIDTNQTLDTTGVDKNGGTTLAIRNWGIYKVPVSTSSIYVVSYMTKSSYISYDPGYCALGGWVSMPKVQSIWKNNMQLLSLPNIENAFTLPITKYVGEYYNVVEVRNGNNSILVKTINDAVDGTSVTFTSSELNTIYTMDDNATSQLPLVFYMDLKTYTNSSKTTQIGTTQRIKCEAYIVNGEPTATYSVVEQDANVINVLGGSTTDKIIKNASDLLFTITPTGQKGATILNVKVNDTYATQSGNDYTLNVTNITTGTFDIVITDSRNLLKTYTITKTPLDYIACRINSWSIERETQVSSNLILNANFSVWTSAINGSTNPIYIRYSFDETNWTTISTYTTGNNTITITDFQINNAISYQNTTPFYIEIYDRLTWVRDRKTISKGIETFSYGENDFLVNGEINIADEDGNNPHALRNFIIEESGVNYIKFADGTLICFFTTESKNVSSYSSQTWNITIPQYYKDTNFAVLTDLRAGGAYWANVQYYSNPSGLNSIYIEVYNNGGNTAENITLDCITIGRWK